MKRRTVWAVAAVLLITAALVVSNQIRKQAARAVARQKAADEARVRQTLFDMLRPVVVSNCELKRFGEPHDGGYLMCGNLLGDVGAGYSYGISGYDKWGCDISSTLGIPVHQYDCFDTRQPACPAGNTIFHAECVAGTARVEEGRPFDTMDNQIAKNGDAGKRIVLKIDVEGAEWDSFLSAPEPLLHQIDQIAVEFHRVNNERYLNVVQRLKRVFHVAHIHFNNHSCADDLDPFPTWAYEVLFVNKRLAQVDASQKAIGLHTLDAPNNSSVPDCQVALP